MEKNKIYWLIGLALAIVILYPYLSQMKFAISDSDFVLVYDDVQNVSGNLSISNGIITVLHNGTLYNYSCNSIVYILDGSEGSPYTSIPSMSFGAHEIDKYEYLCQNNNTQVEIKKWQTIYLKETGPTVYINQTVYQNQTVEVIKEVKIEPTLAYIYQKYQLSIWIIVGLGAAYYFTRKK